MTYQKGDVVRYTGNSARFAKGNYYVIGEDHAEKIYITDDQGRYDWVYPDYFDVVPTKDSSSASPGDIVIFVRPDYKDQFTRGKTYTVDHTSGSINVLADDTGIGNGMHYKNFKLIGGNMSETYLKGRKIVLNNGTTEVVESWNPISQSYDLLGNKSCTSEAIDDEATREVSTDTSSTGLHRVGDMLRVASEKAIDREIRGKIVQVIAGESSDRDSIQVGLKDKAFALETKHIENVVPSVGDVVKFNDESVEVVNVGDYIFNNGKPLKDITNISTRAVKTIRPDSIVTPILDVFSHIPRKVTAIDGDNMTLQGITGAYKLADFQLSDEELPTGIKAYDDDGKVFILAGQVPLQKFLMEEYKIDFPALPQILNGTEHVGLECDTSVYPRVITITKGKTVMKERVKSTLKFINQVIQA